MGYLLTILARMCETAIVAVGAHLSITVSGIFFLGIPSMISLGTYGLMVPQRFGVSMPLSIGISFFLTFIGSLIFVQLYRRLSNDSFTVFSLTSLLAIEACILSLDALTGGPLGIS